MKPAVNHHYVPQFYLRNFADGEGRQAKVFAFDARTSKSFTTLVRNVASKRNFNRIEAEGFDPNFLETESAKIEAQIAPHLQQVIAQKCFPNAYAKALVMELAAMMSARNPARRKNMARFHVDVAKRIMSLALETKERWESQQAKLPPESRSTEPYEAIKEFFESGSYEVDVDQTYLIQQELTSVRTIYELLMLRNWCFISCDATDNQFITCDYPAVLTWTDGRSSGVYSPGYGLANTSVLIPLSPSLLLWGTLEPNLPFRAVNSDEVTGINTHVARHSIDQIYAKNDVFKVNLKARTNVRGRDLPDAMRAEKS